MAKKPASLEEMAETIRKKHGGQQIGAIALWGAMPVQPNDQAYTIGAVRVAGDALEIELGGEALVVKSPQGLASTPVSLVIAEAAAVSWAGRTGSKSKGTKEPAVRLEKY